MNSLKLTYYGKLNVFQAPFHFFEDEVEVEDDQVYSPALERQLRSVPSALGEFHKSEEDDTKDNCKCDPLSTTSNTSMFKPSISNALRSSNVLKIGIEDLWKHFVNLRDEKKANVQT